MKGNVSRNYSFDTLKLICAILVLVIHTPKKEGFWECVRPVCRCAVPLFFMISGYFSYGKNNLDVVLRKRIIKILKILCWAFLLYFLVYVIKDSEGALKSLFRFASPSCIICNSLPVGLHLWFLSAYIYVLVVMLLVEKYNLYKPLFVITPALFIVALVLGVYSERFLGYSLPLCSTRNFIFTGLPFFVLGMMIRKCEYFSRNLRWQVIVLCFVFYLVGVFEPLYANGVGDYYLSTIFLSVSIFILFINIKQTKDNVLSRMGREDSLYIYVFHLFIMESISHSNPVIFYLKAPIVLCLTLLLIFVLKKVKVIGKII